MEQQWNRMQGVKMMREGFAAADVARLFGVTSRAVYKWVAAFSEGGQNALAAKSGAGRPLKLNEEQLRWIADTVRDNTPDQLKFEFGLWTLSMIGALIERQFGMKLSLPTLSKAMRLLGFTTQRPVHRAYEQDPVLVSQWWASDWPQLQATAKVLGAQILFADEAGMRSDYHAGTTWAPQGQTPVVRSTGKRVSVQMISAVSANGQLHFMLHEGRTTAEVFVKFLRQLMTDRTQKVILVVDGHSIHKAGIVQEYVNSTDGLLRLHYLPPYSPQLNPDEQVWKNVKERVSKQKPTDKASLRSLIERALLRLQDLPALVSGFFRHPDCPYIL
ncbi:IS630 family transposase [Sphaerotilus microaerophilus]|nr:IS630 family transposase [Sphaerotilus sp. FB-5]